jgi:hypothetical protein
MDKNNQIIQLLTSLQDSKGGYYATKAPINEMAMGVYLVALSEFTFQQIEQAVQKHIMTPDSGQFFPKVADIIKQLGVKPEREYGWQDCIEGARAPQTPCDVLARIHIQSHYLNNFQSMEIKHRADMFIDGQEERKARALAGNYTEHEIVTMIAHDVKVSSPYMKGMPSIGQNADLRLKYDKAIQSPLHLENVARSESKALNGIEDLDGKKRVLSELKGLLSDKKQLPADSKDLTGAEAEQILKDDLK